MSLFEILTLVIALLSIPVFSLFGWLNPSARNRRKLDYYTEKASKMPKGYERDRWEKIAENQSEKVRLDMHKDFNSDDLMAWFGVLTGVVILSGFLFSEEFRVIFQGIHPILDYFTGAVSGFMVLFSIRIFVRRRHEKRSEALQQEVMIRGMYQSYDKR